jgi:hypothetical protein
MEDWNAYRAARRGDSEAAGRDRLQARAAADTLRPDEGAVG